MIRRSEAVPEGTSPPAPAAVPRPTDAFEENCRTLKSAYSADNRYLAALRLRSFGDRAIEPLYRALEDPAPHVRAGAAEMLGYVGDAAAIPALTRALKATLIGGSRGRQHAWVAGAGITAVALLLLLYGVFSNTLSPEFDHLSLAAFIFLMVALLAFGGSILLARRQNVARIAIVGALARIAAQSGAPEITACLPDLELMAVGGWGQSTEAVSAAREAAVVVRNAVTTTAHPIPAEAPGVAADLPLPSAGSIAVAGPFPRVVLADGAPANASAGATGAATPPSRTESTDT